MGKQRRCGCHKHGVAGGAPHRLAGTSRGEPPDSRQNQEHLFIGAPCQSAGEPLGRRAGLTRNGARDGHVRLGRSDGHKQAPFAKRLPERSKSGGHRHESKGFRNGVFQRTSGLGVHQSVTMERLRGGATGPENRPEASRQQDTHRSDGTSAAPPPYSKACQRIARKRNV